MIPERDRPFLERCFKKYYFDNMGGIRAPDRSAEREYGYQRFGSGMVRHLSLRSDEDLRLFLMNNAPSDVYCSSAFYSFPTLPMKEKDWKEAELIFDIDAKDLGLGCREGHACSRCAGCGGAFAGTGGCPECGRGGAESKSFPCAGCIRGARGEVAKLAGVLTDDLGIPPEKISAYFSGNEGFHVHVAGSGLQAWGARERRSLSDYVSFRNALPHRFGMGRSGRGGRDSFPHVGDVGWPGRVAKEMFGSKTRRPKVVAELVKGGYGEFQRRFSEASSAIGAAIDPSVTMDVHRVFRLPGTLNGKSGLAKARCGDLARFDPYREACPIDDSPAEITADCPLRFALRGRRFGPFGGGERVEVPAFAAAYLICKGFATTV